LQSGSNADANNVAYYHSDYNIGYTADAKFKLGAAFGSNNQILAYGFAGISKQQVNTEADPTPYGYDYSAIGANYGVGLDYAVNDKFTVGVELIGRTLRGYEDAVNRSQFQGSLRAAFHF
jgi:outer membrane immunogenic protein